MLALMSLLWASLALNLRATARNMAVVEAYPIVFDFWVGALRACMANLATAVASFVTEGF